MDLWASFKGLGCHFTGVNYVKCITFQTEAAPVRLFLTETPNTKV